ncbi:hypothetical protein [Bosea sp. UNC402CLCol]|uniref:hypothetical protein n=1 Tax=Bosea sp. UNC402CLCol TaxID=1510531 RepID=UPI0018CD902B|nr:hypothetical protein [Bosea sp. UNC402CLCol]
MAKKTGKKGLETEEIVRSYFLQAGFFVLRGVKLRHAGDELTDIDLWLYERSATLARRRIIIDIKDNAQPKAAERLFFVKGLAEFTQVEAAGIVTSDPRRSLRDLARKHNIIWIDNADLQRLKASQRLSVSSRLSDEAFYGLIGRVDAVRSTKSIRDRFNSLKSSVSDRFGPSCANQAIDYMQEFASFAMKSHPNSFQSEAFTRLVYFCAAIAAASLDFACGEIALRPASERLASLTSAIRHGEDAKGTAEKLRWAEAAIREFAPNGAGLAEMIRSRFNEALLSVPAEGLAEVVARMGNSERLFEGARNLEYSSYSITLPTFDELTVDARSFLGAVLDFLGIERARFSSCWTHSGRSFALAKDFTGESEAGENERPIEEDGKLL